jgi:serine protease Do
MKKPLVIALAVLTAVAALAWSGVAHDLIARLGYSFEYGKAEAARAQLRSGADIEHAFELVAESLQPSVVWIATTKILRPPPGQAPFGDDPFFNHPLFRRFFDSQGIPQQGLRQRGLGSGVIVSQDGVILTNNHVVEGMDELVVHLSDRRSFKAKVAGTDPRTEIAVIRIDADNLLPAPLGDSDTVKVGQWVAAFGSPFGLDQTVTAGIISAKGRAHLGITDFEDFLQTDAAINQGNSGGPLVNLKGEVIGINTAIVSRSGGSAGVGFAVPANLARKVMDRLLAEGKIVRGFLGVLIQDLTSDLAEPLGLKAGRGVLVSEVTPRSPAEKAGLRPGDAILRLDGNEVTGVAAFRNRIADIAPGTQVKLLVRRDDEDLDIVTTIGELGEGQGQAQTAPQPAGGLGIEVQDLTPQIRRNLNLDDRLQGAVIATVESGSPADLAGLRPGDVIVGVARQAVRSADEAQEQIEKADLARGVVLRVKSGDTTRFVFVRAQR